MSVLTAKNVFKEYLQNKKSIEILKDVSFSMETGESLAIVGPSGSGKSTLLSILSGLDHLSSGKIIVNGVDISEYSEKQLCDFRAKNVGIVFQQYHLMPHLNALENVLLPLEVNHVKNSRLLAEEVLRNFGLVERMLHLPHELSGGECQRVAIARAMVHSPKIIFADEPSGNLDAKTGDLVMSQLFAESKKQDMALVLVTHNNELAWQCDRVLTLADGALKK